MTAIARIISGLVQRQIERGFEPTQATDAYRSDWRDGRAARQRGERCPRWQTRAFKRGYREGR